MTDIDFATLGFGMLLGLVASQFIAVWALNKALRYGRDAVEFRRECLDAVIAIQADRSGESNKAAKDAALLRREALDRSMTMTVGDPRIVSGGSACASSWGQSFGRTQHTGQDGRGE